MLARPMALALALLSTACSLQGLDRLPFTRCAEEMDCDALDRRDGVQVDDCMGWECERRFCRWRRRDADDDGAFRATDGAGVACGAPTEEGDCDDLSDARSPRLLEICDGLDQDCDLAIDEGGPVVMAATAPIALLELEPGAQLFELGSAERGAAAISYRFASGGAGLERIAGSTPFVADPARQMVLVLETAGVATPAAGCALSAGEPIAPDATCATVADCGAGETCAARSVDGLLVCGSGGPSCVTDEECGDGLSCTGIERCAPGSPGADARGCLEASPRHGCGDDTCDEALDECRRPPPMLADCRGLRALASAPIGDGAWVAAAIAGLCAEGALRIAHFEADAPLRALVAGGDGERSSSWDGIDADASGCTGASRASGVRGARGPSVAALPGTASRTSQALVAFLAGPTGSSTPAPVEVIGVWAERDDAGRRWTHATGSGVPSALSAEASGTTTRPSVAAIDHPTDSAFVVGYGAEAGGVALFVLDALGEPGPLCDVDPTRVPCVDAGTDGPVTTIRDAYAERTSGPLGAATELRLPGGRIAGDVSIAVGLLDLRANVAEVAIAYIEGDEVVLAPGEVDLASRALTVAAGATRRLPAAGAETVSVVHVDAGLAATTSLETSGGYLLSWSGASGTFVARRRDLDGVLDEPARLSTERMEAVRAFTAETAGRASLAVVARRLEPAGGDVMVFSTLCEPPAP